jgi:hypothetical protein
MLRVELADQRMADFVHQRLDLVVHGPLLVQPDHLGERVEVPALRRRRHSLHDYGAAELVGRLHQGT